MMKAAREVIAHLQECLTEASLELTSATPSQKGLRLLFEDGSQWFLGEPIQLESANLLEEEEEDEDDDEEEEEDESVDDDEIGFVDLD